MTHSDRIVTGHSKSSRDCQEAFAVLQEACGPRSCSALAADAVSVRREPRALRPQAGCALKRARLQRCSPRLTRTARLPMLGSCWSREAQPTAACRGEAATAPPPPCAAESRCREHRSPAAPHAWPGGGTARRGTGSTGSTAPTLQRRGTRREAGPGFSSGWTPSAWGPALRQPRLWAAAPPPSDPAPIRPRPSAMAPSPWPRPHGPAPPPCPGSTCALSAACAARPGRRPVPPPAPAPLPGAERRP